MDCKVVCGLLMVMLSGTNAAPKEDLVTYLPGLTWKPNFKQYSGYLQASGTKQLHYWLAESQRDPQEDPVAVFYVGGPACSSLFSVLTENGPFHIRDDGQTLMKNPYSWNRIANMLYIEMPAGVGFSYSDDKNYTTDDDLTAKDNHLALRDFFRKFPEYRKNDFFLTGVSYSGIYIPTLAMLILEDSSFNFKGFAVGNGLLDLKLNDNSLVYFLVYHGVIGTDTWDKLWGLCCQQTKSGDICDFDDAASKSPDCNKELQAVLGLAWNSGLNPYNLYAECYGGGNNHFKLYFDPQLKKIVWENFGDPYRHQNNKEISRQDNLTAVSSAGQFNADIPCLNCKLVDKYLNLPDVRKALHIPNEVQSWTPCSSTLKYTTLYKTMRPQYMKAINSKKLRLFVYNGDVDMACNFLGDEWFVDGLNLEDPQTRRAWYYKAEDGTRQIAGYFKAYPESNLTFLTIKGGQHSSERNKPLQALMVLDHFFSGKPVN